MWLPILGVVIAINSANLVFAQKSDDCVCVAYYLCRKNGTINTDGEGIFDERLGAAECDSCKCTGLDVCCRLPSANTITPVNATQSQCGYRNPDGVGFKVGADGTDTVFGEFPWMVRIFKDGEYKCGGSIIHQSVILTAAHCVKNTTSVYTIRAGEWDTSNTNEVLKHKDRNVSSIKIHENFNPKVLYNDIALVYLDQPLEFEPHVNTICLVPSETVVTNTRCFAAGWGKATLESNQTYSVILKKVDLPIVDKSTCQTLLRKTRLGPYFNLHESFNCAGGEKDKDTCKGDGGSPLFCPIDNEDERYQQVGIVSWGIDCNEPENPGIYADIAGQRKWIDKQMKDNNFDTKTYQ